MILSKLLKISWLISLFHLILSSISSRAFLLTKKSKFGFQPVK